MIKMTAFLTTKIEVRRIYLHMVPDEWNTRAYIDVEDVIINFSPASKRLEDGVKRPCVAEKQHIEIFWVDQFCITEKAFSHEMVCSKKKNFYFFLFFIFYFFWWFSIYKMQWKMSWDKKRINNEIMQLKTFNSAGKENLLIIKFKVI